MKVLFIVLLAILQCKHSNAQDSLYTREVIEYLTNKKCFGRGYVKNGLYHAERYLVNELRSSNVQPLLSSGYTQEFFHPVNTFPSKVKVKLNGRKLEPGADYILDPASRGLAGRGLVSIDGWGRRVPGSAEEGSVLLR